MELLKKVELLKEFEVKASFYNVRLNDYLFECRNQARIRRKGISKEEYDAVFILCNPGSCKSTSNIREWDPRKDCIPFVTADSDQTQEQIMRLMVIKQWDQVNIINISDICSGNIEEFRRKLSKANRVSFSYHSIFSNERNHELLDIFRLNKGPIIAGWGKRTFMKNELIEVLASDNLKNIKGWKNATHPYYYHPFLRIPNKNKEWLIKVNEQLSKEKTIG